MFKDRILHLFDLDGTAIDSLHRVAPCLEANGDLNLPRYRAEACQHSKIMADRLLPLADHMKALIDKGESVGICTARFMRKSDYVFLRQHGLKTALIASRDRLHKAFPPEMAQAIMRSGDAAYKSAWLQHLKATRTETVIHLYDDHDGVLAAAASLGVVTFDAKTINERLDLAFRQGMQAALDQQVQDDFDMMPDESLPMLDDHDALTFGPIMRTE
ncbi:deoxynucleoside-5'-monophosphatase [Aeromonas phage AhSzw-1]|uniref:Deoxynucleoside-5'-monophosphatase n=1 Tax=Aeromonas phage AhSzw-1 TaxID=2138299 RepID=A0A2R4AMB4_9CAUD|nr:deoxynucleoside-5'-monophosphatase [Aeromonas phage AhSzw-1]AVR76170.1 deoxynucleoside-5'-monophosphatase [Aeromonas phage AhSzw-1]